MSKPPKNNNNNKKFHNQSDFSYFNNPNYFGFYHQDWNNTYSPSYIGNSKNESLDWDNNPTPTYHYNQPWSGHNINNQLYYNNQPYYYNQPYYNKQPYYSNQPKRNFSKSTYTKKSDKVESKRGNDSNNIRKPSSNSIVYKKIKIMNPKKKEGKQKNKPKKKNFLFKINRNKPIDEIETDIKTIDDILQLGALIKKKDFKSKNYSINVKGIHKMTEPLKYLKNMVGLEDIKTRILEQVIFFSQDIHNQVPFFDEPKPSPEKSSLDKLFGKFIEKEEPKETTSEISLEIKNKFDMLHTIIEGPPGVGKTQLGKVLAKIYLSLGIIQSDKFRIATRKDFIGEYLGHTAIKTQKVIDSCLGGVLFIDEAYSLGNGDSKKDSFSKECIDTLNQNLSENKGKFVCIIAGYKENLEHDFFSVNPGLQRRFPFRYSIEKYSPKELTQILINKVSDIEWSLDDDCLKWLNESNFIEDKMDSFKNFGGDIESWLLHSKIEHAKRVFGKCHSHHKVITQGDISKGYLRFLENKSDQKSKNETPLNMYL